MAGMSRRAFASDFKLQAGVTPGDYLRQFPRHYRTPLQFGLHHAGNCPKPRPQQGGANKAGNSARLRTS